MATARNHPALGSLEPAEAEQRLVIPGVTWKEYVLLNDAIDTPGVRMSYCEGRLEIMTTSRKHEWIKTTVARLLETWALERDIPLHGNGQMTFRLEARERGAEPDECWAVGQDMKDYPEIVLEVVLSHGGLDKLAVYHGMGVPEVWFWIDERFHLYRLGEAGYSAVERSVAIPALDFGELVRFVKMDDQHAAVKALRDRLRRG